MTLVKTRAAFEKAITDSVLGADSQVKVFYDNTAHAVPGKNTKYVEIELDFASVVANEHGPGTDFHTGSIRCKIFVPRSKGTAVLSAISGSVISGLKSVNATNYVDTYAVSPRVEDIVGPISIDLADNSHFLGVVSCGFSTNP